jgi:hypothetical protein
LRGYQFALFEIALSNLVDRKLVYAACHPS